MFFYNKSKTLYFLIIAPVILCFIEQQMNIWIGTNGILSVIKYSIMMLCSILLLKYAITYHQRIGIIRFLFIVWILYLLISSYSNLINPYKNHLYLKKFLSEYLFLYLIPLCMIIKFDLNTLKNLFLFSYWLSFIYLILAIPVYVLTNNSFESESLSYLLGGSLMLMMTLPYHNIKKNWMVLLSIIVCIVIMMLLGRRNVVLYLGGGLCFAAILNIFGASKLTIRKNYRYIFIIVAIACLIGMYLFSSSFEFFFDRVATGMDSREIPIEWFFYDFNKTPTDWIFGRGIYGEVLAGVLAKDNTGLRDGIENGYLMLILKGGLIWLTLLILISLKSIYLGLFKSKNRLCKGFALIIILYFVDMIGFAIPGVYLKYIMIFIGISVCNSKYLRECSDDKLVEIIGLK